MTISTVPLWQPSTQSWVEASLQPITQKDASDWVQYWVPAIQNGLQQATIRAASVDVGQIPRWNWKDKIEAIHGLLSKNGFSITYEGVTQGLMIYDLSVHRCRLEEQKGKDLVYVEYLEVAPWNRNDLMQGQARFGGIGSTLLAAAIELSRQEDFKGRIGLHSLPGSESFYAYGGMSDLGVDESSEGLRYFEMTAEQATAFFRKGD
ncbi:GNAT family N-acetyltransferase [Pseudomonas sp. DY-1]|uniref:GNAT family N-acetyltransferase n=1 Tax=Pseudomonas sp. DY-1 TaxID=1755504 RepID=UPI000EAA5155|nr:GNAT family N-acetyltransferase [Pseudomonas sp. DY-1]AYF88161.1 GNAT family N-acetyltransferase [Pseudomonas sp. DY-1]